VQALYLGPLFAAPWLVALVWFVRRYGLSHDVPPSAAEEARRRLSP
jgi:hypothetical protein